jgi:hypothetical protein
MLPRCLAAVLTLTLLGSGAAVTAPVPLRKDEVKKKPADKEEAKKSDADKELDEMVEEMTRNMPPFTDESVAKRVREQMRQNLLNMPAEQRKNMLNMMRGRQGGGFPGQGVAGRPMPPGFAAARPDGRLGARVEPASATLAEQLELPKGQGLVVREVQPDSAADKAGLKAHDILLELNGKTVPNRLDGLRRLLADIKPDAAVEVVVLRKGKKETIKDVKLPEAKETAPGFAGGLPGAPGGFPPGAPQLPPGGFPQPGAGGFPPGAPFGGDARSVMTTMIHTQDRFTLRHQEGSLIITLTGSTTDGKAKIKSIHVQDGARPEKYEEVDKVPEQYRDKVKNLIDMSEKSKARIEIKSP